MSRKLIAEQLKKSMGLHSPTVGMMTVSSAIDRRMRAREYDADEKYLAEIRSNPTEMKELIEAVLIPETWFFRESEPYEYVLKYIEQSRNKHVVNILSLPCSTGEEPYSIAMLLMDNNISVDAFRIDAVDIGENNISKAKKGQYRQNSFRTENIRFKEKYFDEENKLFNLAGFVKNKVNFYCQNALNDSFNLGITRYDIVFCRNLLIYFDSPTQRKMFSIINRLLKPDGMLILGNAETIQYSGGIFVPAVNAKSYVYVKESNLEKSLPHHQKKRRHQSPAYKPKTKAAVTRTRPFIKKTKMVGEPTAPLETTNKVDNADLDKAFSLANEGRLDEALTICNDYINKNIDSPKAYYLIGVIYDTRGDIDKANKSLHKALYLDPYNIEALIHLALIAEQNGNHDDASRFKQRAQRIKERRTA